MTRTSCYRELASFLLEAKWASGCFVLCFGHCRKCRIVRSVDCGPSRPRSQLGRLHGCRINPQVCVPYRVSATGNSAHRRSWVSATDDRRRTIRRSGHRLCFGTFPGVSRAARACMATASEYFDAVNWFRAVHLGNGRGQLSGTPPTLELGGDVLGNGPRGEPPRRGSVLLSSLAGRRLGVNSCGFSFG